MSSTDLVTIVATDWVESTATRARLGEERADELQHVHDQILGAVVDEYGGRVVKYSGDGVLATFHSTTDALAAAVAIQQQFDAYSTRDEATARICLRIGISAGDVLNRDDDIFGTPVIEAVRLEGVAAPGQILCSELVRVLSRGRGGFELELVGLFELKGLAEPVAACSVRWEPVVRAEPPLALPSELATANLAPFVGRDDEMQLATALALGGEQAQMLWLLGEPGIGKTRLAAEVAACAHASGALALYGRCDEQVRAPFQPFIDALRWLMSRQRDDELLALLGSDPEPLVRLVPELHARLPDLPLPERATETEQYRLFESVRACLGAISEVRPAVFVVDDVHWADRPTLALLGHVLRHAQAARLTIVATARNTDPDITDPLRDLLDDLERTGRSRRVELLGLTTGDIARLVEASASMSADSALVAAQLAEETAGNPLFVGAVLAGVGTDGSLPRELPTDVRAAVRRRVGRLEPGAQELLQVAALTGLEFSLGVASDAAGLSDSEGLTRVEQAISAGLVEEIGIDRFRFTHALVRDVLEAEISASRGARIHAAIARSIEARFSGRLDDHLHALARHCAAAGTSEMLERAQEYATRAGRRSDEMLAFDAAAEDFTFALAIDEQIGPKNTAGRLELILAKGEAEFNAGTHRTALRTFSAAAALARTRQDWDAFTRAVRAHEETNWRPGLLGHESAALLREALEHEHAPGTRLLLRAAYARALHFTGDPDAIDVAEEALRDARALGDPEVIAYALAAAIQTLAENRVGEPELALRYANEVETLLVHSSDALFLHAIEHFAAIAALSIGDRREFDRWIDQVLAWKDLRFHRYVGLNDRQMVAFMDGELTEAEALAQQALDYGEGLGEDVTGPNGLQMFLIRREQDRLGEVAPLVQMLLRANPTEAMWAPGLAMLLGELGMRAEGEALLEQLTAGGVVALPRDALYPGALCLLSESAFLLRIPEPASLLDVELRPWAYGGVPLGHSVAFIGAVNRYRAMLAWLEGRLDDADARFGEALDFNRRVESPVWIARTLAGWAALRQERGDVDGAALLAAEGSTLAARHGLAAVARSIRELELETNPASD